MEIDTARFGSIRVNESELIRFEQGILGFEGIRRYVLIPYKPGSPFMFLQAVDDPNLTFVVMDPLWMDPTYQVKVLEEDLAAIDLGEDEDASILVIVRLPKGGEPMTANLLAPLVINARNGAARQVVQQDAKHSIHTRITRGEKGSNRTGAQVNTSGAPMRKLVKVG